MEKSTSPQWLMCPPIFYGVEYEINSWMKGNIGIANQEKAQRQWDKLYQLLTDCSNVTLLPPVAGLPDFTFTANAGLVFDHKFIPARFRHPERQREELHFKNWFRASGYKVIDIKDLATFEGEGDALFQLDEPLIWFGHGMRSNPAAQYYLTKILNIEVISLRLINPHFYHLDTCFTPLPDGHVLYYPPAFDSNSLKKIQARIPANKRIEACDEDALNFACNAVICQNKFISNHVTEQLRRQLEKCNLEAVTTPLTEFMFAGGAAKCLVLSLTHAINPEDKVNLTEVNFIC